eukprot:2825977-Pyramimonas_sp.AAC.1
MSCKAPPMSICAQTALCSQCISSMGPKGRALGNAIGPLTLNDWPMSPQQVKLSCTAICGRQGLAHPWAVMPGRLQARTRSNVSELTMKQSSSEGSLVGEYWQVPAPASTTWPPTSQSQRPAR